jgi:hypothetical protein
MVFNYFCIFIIFLIILILVYFLLYESKIIGGGSGARSGARKIPSKNIIVDTLNVTHWMRGKVSSHDISETISTITPILARIYKGGDIMFVLKDRDNSFYTEEDHKLFKWLSDKNKVTIYVAEKYKDPPQSQNKQTNKHSTKGRDDFYMSVLAAKYKCGVITEDSLKDFAEFRNNIQPFYVLIYRFWKDIPDKDYIRPEIGYAKLRRPFRIHPSMIFTKKMITFNEF